MPEMNTNTNTKIKILAIGTFLCFREGIVVRLGLGK